MTSFIGRLVKLGIAKESTRGVGVAPTQWIPTVEFSGYDKADKIASEESRGGIWGFGNEDLVVSKYAEGSINMDLGNETLPLFLLATFGTLSSGAFLSANKHTFSLQNDNIHDSLTLTVVDEIEQVQYERAMISTFEIEAAVGEMVKCNIEFASNPFTDTTGHTPSFPTTNFLFGHQDVNLYIAATTGALPGSKIPIKGLTLTIEKNLMKNFVLGTVQPKDIQNQQFLITGEIELDYEATTYKDYMLDESYKALRIDIVNSNQTIGSTNPAFRIDLSRVAFSEFEMDRPLNELVGQKIKFKALYDPTNSDVVHDCYVVNQTASY